MAMAIRSAYLAGMFERVKPGVIFGLWLVLQLVAPKPAQACSCLATTLDQARSESEAIFEGRVDAVEAGATETVVRFRVTQAWRGVVHEQVEVRMPTGSAACAFPFQEGVIYLVFARASADGLHTSLCSRTAAMDDETAQADRQALGSGTIPVDVEDTELSPPPVREHPSRAGCASCAAQREPLSSAASVLCLVALAFVVRRRSSRRG